MRKTYIYCPTEKRMIEKPDVYREPCYHIMPDIQPYQVVGPEYGKLITSRSKHREYLHSHGLTERGDEQPEWMKEHRRKKKEQSH